MSSRRRKPGANSPWQEVPLLKPGVVDIVEVIERLDYARFDASLKRVRSHPKNLLRLLNKRAADTQESKRNSSNIASYNAAVRRVMRRR